MSGVEIERKYVIEMPSLEQMSRMEEYTSSEITQIYLESESGITHRVRRRVYASGQIEYTETKKIRIDRLSSIEDEHRICREEFELLGQRVRRGSSPLQKVRHTFIYGGKLIEIDEYREWQRSCIMETELLSPEETVALPPFIKIVKEVTGDKAYSNSSMSSSFPPELI